jgi:large subunit ribosomal protein L4
MKFKLYTSDASKSSEVEIKNFPVIDSKDAEKGARALKQYLIAYMANQRQGNASTMSRNQKLSTPGKKWYAQKGTGRSRHGDRTAPQLKGGAVAFGPHPRKYTQKINAQAKTMALVRALAEAAPKISLIEKFDVGSKPATKTLSATLRKISDKGALLIVDDSYQSPVLLSARNIARLDVGQASQLNAFDLVRYPSIVVSLKGLEKILSRIQP